MADIEEKIGCLEAAISAYRNSIDEKDIKEAYAAMKSSVKNASASDLAPKLEEFRKNNIYERETYLLANKLSYIKNLESINDNIRRAHLFLDKNVSNPGYKALHAKITGTKHSNVNDASNSTDTNVNRARQSFFTRFMNDLKDAKLNAVFDDLSEANQIAIYDAYIRRNHDAAIPGQADETAAIIGKHYDQLDQNLTAQGVLTRKLKSRGGPNIHDQRRMMRLSLSERLALRSASQTQRFEYLYQRWKNHTTPLLNPKTVFESRNIDPHNEEQLDAFMRPAFDNLINKGKASQRDANLGIRNTQSRVLDWKDGKSAVMYNNLYGSGSIQHNIIMELSNGFKDVEILKHWGQDPIKTLRASMSAIDAKEEFSKILHKKRNIDNLEHLLEGLVGNDSDYAGSIGTINRNLRNIAVMGKLGMVMLKSIQDVSSLANEASRAGLNPLSQLMEAMKGIGRAIGMTDHQKEMIGKIMDNSRSMEMSAHLNTYNLSKYNITNLTDKGAHAMMKWSGIHRWDYGMRSSSHAIWAQYFARYQKMDYDKIANDQKSFLNTYGIDKSTWQLMRASKSVRLSKGKYFSPELVQDVHDDTVREILKEKGNDNPTDYDIKEFKDGAEQSLLSFMYDRADHVVQRPNTAARRFLQPNFIKNDLARFAVDQIMIFKSFGLSYSMRNIHEKFYQRGASSFIQGINPFSKTQNILRLKGSMAALLVRNMALGYAGKTLINLANGLSPPSFRDYKTWAELAGDSVGFYSALLATDEISNLAGPNYASATKLVKLLYHGVNAKGIKVFKKDLFQLLSPNIPFGNLYFLNYVIKNTILGDWQDAAEPGIREKRLAQLKEEQGVHTLWNQNDYLHPKPYRALKKIF